MNSGTTALASSLYSADVKPGNEVIAPALTFISTAFFVNQTSTIFIFIDADLSTFTVVEADKG